MLKVQLAQSCSSRMNPRRARKGEKCDQSFVSNLGANVCIVFVLIGVIFVT